MSVSVYYCFGITEGLDPVHLVPNDHYLVPYFTNLREFRHVGPQLHVMVSKPPNLADGNHDGAVRLWLLQTGHCVRVFQANTHALSCMCAHDKLCV
jgi:hypothetical protein